MFRNQIMICLCHIIVRSIGFTIWQNYLGEFSSWVVQKSKLKFRRIILATQIYLYVDKVAAGSPIRLPPWQSGESQRCPELGYWRGNGGKWIYLKDTVFIRAATTEYYRPHGLNNLFLTIPEVGKSKIKAPSDPLSGEGLFPGLQVAILSLYPHTAERERSSWCVF